MLRMAIIDHGEAKCFYFFERSLFGFPQKKQKKKEILYPIFALDYEQQQVQWKLIGYRAT